MLTDDVFTTEPPTGTTHRPCGIGRVLEELSPEEREVLEKYLAMDAYEYAPGRLVNVLTKAGHDQVNTNHVVNHRRRKCACFR